MNDLSWFLYLADVLPRTANGLGVTSFLTSIFGGLGLVFWIGIARMDEDVSGPPKGFVAVWCVAFFLTIICSLVPSRQTIYLIAGSEAGEYVVKSQEGQEIINDIKAVIKQQLKVD